MNYNIYGLTTQRNRQILDLFIDHYCNRSDVEDRKDEELMILKKTLPETCDKDSETHYWKKSDNLTNHFNIGLEPKNHCFALYIDAIKPDINQVIIKFTSDGKLILGLCVDAGENGDKPLAEAIKTLNELKRNYGINADLILIETPPPDNEVQFYQEFIDSDLRIE